MRTTIAIVIVLTAMGDALLSAQNVVDYHTLGTKTVVIGQLGVPLGTVVQVDATVVAGRSLGSKDLASDYLLKVSKVGSNAISNPPICQFRTHSWDAVKIAPDEFSLYELKKGKKADSLSDAQIARLERGYVGQAYRLLVYEEGVFSGVPRGLPRDSVMWQDRSFGFRTYLIVLRIIEEPRKPNPQGGANGRQPVGSVTNQTSAGAASRRSP